MYLFLSKIEISMRKYLKIIEKIFKHFLTDKRYIAIYLILVLAIVIITLRQQESQEVEHFNNSKFKNKHVKYSDCKKECSIKYDDPDKVKVCKKYCKCKRNCSGQLNSKKCLKGCKDIKMNIYRDDEHKLEKIKLKKEIKIDEKKKKKEIRIKEEREVREKNKQNVDEGNKKKGFLMRVINNYASEHDRMFLLDLSSSSSRFYKDFKNVFKVK